MGQHVDLRQARKELEESGIEGIAAFARHLHPLWPCQPRMHSVSSLARPPVHQAERAPKDSSIRVQMRQLAPVLRTQRGRCVLGLIGTDGRGGELGHGKAADVTHLRHSHREFPEDASGPWKINSRYDRFCTSCGGGSEN